MKAAISPELLRILACPECKGNLRLVKNQLICKKCWRKYPIKEGIPHLLPDELR
ncbi:MAG: Trm112 family protein [Candidatus Hadarchaeales archaeon]